MLPRIILSKAVSVDGRIDGFEREMELESQVYQQIRSEGFLMDVISHRSFINMIPEEILGVPPPDFKEELDPRPVLFLYDPEGKIDLWDKILKIHSWKDRVVIVDDDTPEEYLGELEKRSIKYISSGEGKHDIGTILELIYERYGVRSLIIDSDGDLNGKLMKDGYIDEVNMMIYPFISGGCNHFLNIDDLDKSGGPIKLGAIKGQGSVEKLTWVRYLIIRTVLKPGIPGLDESVKIKELMAGINSGMELYEHEEEVLSFIDNTMILAVSTLKGLEGMSLTPDEVMERISGLMESQGVFEEHVERNLKRISQLPDSRWAVDLFERSLSDRREIYGKEAQDQLMKFGVKLPGM